RARLADRYVDCRKVDVWAVVDVHLAERNQPGQRQADEQDYRDHLVTDRPCRNVQKGHWPDARRPALSATGLPRSPSLTKPPARRITRSVPSRPATIAIPSSVTMPVRTLRRTTRFSRSAIST